MNPQLHYDDASLNELFQRQTQSFEGCNEVSEDSILRQLPVLCAKSGFQDGVWSQEKGLFIPT